MSRPNLPWLILAGFLVLALWIYVLNELVWSAQLLEGCAGA